MICSGSVRRSHGGSGCRNRHGIGNARLPRRGSIGLRFVRTARRHGIRVHVWTINDAPTMDALLELGVDGIVTDQPDVLRAVLEQRGLWEE